MSNDTPHIPQWTEKPTGQREKALLVGVVLPQSDLTSDGTLEELSALADTAGMMVLDRLIQRRERIDSRYFVGRGKAEELAELCERLEVERIVFDHELSPAQARNLERLTKAVVLTRTEVILDIFARRARTRQARLQVELAQLRYQLPRLRRMWTHLSRLEGGVGSRGPGETQLEVDRRAARKRIHDLEKSLKQIEKRKRVQTATRRDYFTIALVGYTNVGKSSLMNAVTGTGAFVEDRLFATLDATTRLLRTAAGRQTLLTDTVGFIRNLPHDLVASFHATLEEVREADLLLHVADVAAEQLDEQMTAVRQVLTQLGCQNTPTLTVLNKADQLPPNTSTEELTARYGAAYLVSARTGFGLESLLAALDEQMADAEATVRVQTSTGDGRLRAYLAEQGTIVEEQYDAQHAKFTASLNPGALGRLRRGFPHAAIEEVGA